MAERFKIYVFTSPSSIEDEANKLTSLLEAGVDTIHIRKPDWSVREVKNLIEDIPYEFRKKLRLHGHFELLNEMNLAGVHLNSRNPNCPYNAMSKSIPLHSEKELESASSYEYATLSPIFNSISKKGYKSKFSLDQIENKISGKNIVALGGVTPANLFLLKEKGFSGAALLGYIWNGCFDEVLNELKTAILNLN